MVLDCLDVYLTGDGAAKWNDGPKPMPREAPPKHRAGTVFHGGSNASLVEFLPRFTPDFSSAPLLELREGAFIREEHLMFGWAMVCGRGFLFIYFPGNTNGKLVVRTVKIVTMLRHYPDKISRVFYISNLNIMQDKKCPHTFDRHLYLSVPSGLDEGCL